MSRTVLLTASVVLALVVACMVVVIAFMKPAEAAFPGRNGDIAFTNYDGTADIYRINPDGTGLERLTDIGGWSQYPAYSADGQRIAFQNDADDMDEVGRDIWVMDADGKNETNLTNTPSVDEWFPAWFPSGNKVVYSGSAGIEVITLNANDEVVNATRLTGGTHPAISPNGEKLAFSSARDRDSEIYVMRSRFPEGPGNHPVNLTNNAVHDADPNWAPDSSKVVYESCQYYCDIFVMNADGSNKKNLTRTPSTSEHSPAFSPNGKYIVHSKWSDDSGSRQIWRMKVDGSDKVQLTDNSDSDVSGIKRGADWQPLP